MGYYADGRWELKSKLSMKEAIESLKTFDGFNYYSPKDDDDIATTINEIFGELCEDVSLELDLENNDRLEGYLTGKLILNEKLLDAISKVFNGHADYIAEDGVLWRWRFGEDEVVEHAGEIIYPSDPLDK
jgi:hypothetical protein